MLAYISLFVGGLECFCEYVSSHALTNEMEASINVLMCSSIIRTRAEPAKIGALYQTIK